MVKIGMAIKALYGFDTWAHKGQFGLIQRVELPQPVTLQENRGHSSMPDLVLFSPGSGEVAGRCVPTGTWFVTERAAHRYVIGQLIYDMERRRQKIQELRALIRKTKTAPG